jgi:hypothetical protein
MQRNQMLAEYAAKLGITLRMAESRRLRCFADISPTDLSTASVENLHGPALFPEAARRDMPNIP